MFSGVIKAEILEYILPRTSEHYFLELHCLKGVGGGTRKKKASGVNCNYSKAVQNKAE